MIKNQNKLNALFFLKLKALGILILRKISSGAMKVGWKLNYFLSIF